MDTITVPSFTLILASPDEVNEAGRNAGLPVQAVSLTDAAGNKIWLSWPPKKKGDPDFEYGMDVRSLHAALGYEILSNLLHRDYDPLGR